MSEPGDDSSTGVVQERIHLCPPIGYGFTPCCDRTPFELPPYDRITLDEKLVTCDRQ